MKAKILIVDDDPKICDVLSDLLEENRFQVSVANTTEEGFDTALRFHPDLILLDVEIPLKGGLELCRELKQSETFQHIPVIFLTVRNQEMDVTTALNVGGDDFITKPFRQNELIARINAALRRFFLVQPISSTARSGALLMDFNSRVLKINGRGVHLTPKEFDLLKLLVINRNRVLSERSIFDQVWGSECNSMLSTVHTHIERLRVKLKDQGAKIKTVPGVGYRFDERKLREK